MTFTLDKAHPAHRRKAENEEPTGEQIVPRYKPTNPHRIARALLANHQRDQYGHHTLRHYRSQYWRWDGQRYQPEPADNMTAFLTEFARQHFVHTRALDRNDCVPSVTTNLIANVHQALAALVKVDDKLDAPVWIGKEKRGPFLAFTNGLVSLDSLLSSSNDAEPAQHPSVSRHSPEWFSPVCFDYDYDPSAVCPMWLKTLDRILEGDSSASPSCRSGWA